VATELDNEIDGFNDSDLMFDLRSDVRKAETILDRMERQMRAAFEAGYLAGRRSAVSGER
jgi:hypothetical protein